MSHHVQPRSRAEFRIGIICALRIESDAVESVFDEIYEDDTIYGKAQGDTNSYTYGTIGQHDVVLAYIPGMGKRRSATVAASFRSSFPNMRLVLLVGICGGAATDPNGVEILLGDVIVSTGVVQYDFGRQLPDQALRKNTLRDNLASPNMEVQGLLSKLEGLTGRKRLKKYLNQYLLNVQEELPGATYPGLDEDILYESTYRHKHYQENHCDVCNVCKTREDPVCQLALDSSCTELECGNEHVVIRRRIENLRRKVTSSIQDEAELCKPEIHFGLVASGDLVMKSGYHRDQVATREDVIAFEMEGAGVWDIFPTVVIKSVCDYADSHKNKKWQRYAAATAASCMKAFLREWAPQFEEQSIVLEHRMQQLPISEIPPEETFAIPFGISEATETQNFVGRREELAEIHEHLQYDNSRRIVVLHGLGGMGKTQLSIAYASSRRDEYSAVFWLNCKDEDALKQSYLKVAKRILEFYPTIMYLETAVESGNADLVVDSVNRWLNLTKNSRWLLLYDNHDNPKLAGEDNPGSYVLDAYIPPTHHGSIIITTRSSRLEIGHQIKLHGLEDIRQNLEILSYISKRQIKNDDSDALKLIKKLGGLPLALATTGAYLRQTSISLSQYLVLYDRSWLKLQKTTPNIRAYEDRTLYSTWMLSLEHVKRQNEQAAKFLDLCAFFGNQDVWFELLRAGRDAAPDWFVDLTEDELSFNQAAGLLCDHSLIEADPLTRESMAESAGYSMHTCVHSWTSHVLAGNQEIELARLALQCVGFHVPEDTDRDYRITQSRLLQHANRLNLDLLEKLLLHYKDQQTFDAIHAISILYRYQAKYDEAESVLKLALGCMEKILGSEHSSILGAVHNLGLIHWYQGKLEDAERLYQQALKGMENTIGPNQAETLRLVNDLGIVYKDLGNLEAAEKSYLRALHGKQELIGKNHKSTLDTVYNLGLLRKDQGKQEEAEEMYKWALKGYEDALGPEHTSTLDTVHNLGVLYLDQGKLEEVEKMYLRALEGYEHTLGADNISTIDMVYDLGVLYLDQNNLTDAEKMYLRALQGYEQALGTDHRSTLDTVNGLGIVYWHMGKLDDAEKMYTRSLEASERVLGKLHKSTLDTVYNMSLLRKDQGDIELAEQLTIRSLEGYKEILGQDHVSALDCLHNLGSIYWKQEKLKESEEYCELAAQGYTKALEKANKTSRPTLNSVRNLGDLFREKNQPRQAEKMYELALKGFRAVCSPNDQAVEEVESRLVEIRKALDRMDYVVV